MRTSFKLAVTLLCTTAAVPALAQQVPQPVPAPQAASGDEAESTAEDIVVSGIRESLQSSAQRKKNTMEVVDSITADDIGKLPDNNVADTLSRVPGVQAYRFGGESASPVGQGSGLTVRGLSGQTASQVDGRAYITAGGREFNVEGASPGMVAGIEVYKNPSAEHIEGGIGGLVDIRTRRPLDFSGTAVSASVGGRYNDLGKKVTPELFGLFSTRWNVGEGEMGLLLAGSYTRSFNRGDNTPSGGGTSIRRAVRANSTEYITLGLNPAYAGRSDVTYLADVNPLTLSAADRANLVSTVTEGQNVFQEDYMRTRKGLSGSFQWRPSSTLEFYLDGNYNYYLYNQHYRFLTFGNSRYVQNATTTPFTIDEDLANRNSNGGANEILSGTRLAGGTFLGSTAGNIGGDEHTSYQTYLLAGGVKWQPTEHLDVHFDYSYVKADRSQDNRSVTGAARAGLLFDITRTLTGGPHGLTFTGADLSNPGNWVFSNYANGTNQVWDDNTGAAALDLKYSFDDSFLKDIKVGARYSVLESRYHNYSFGGRNLTTNGLPLAADQSNGILFTAMPDLITNAPTNFMNGAMGYSGGYAVFNPTALLGDNVRARFPGAGILPEDNLAENLLARRYFRERSYAGYAVADFRFLDDRIRGNVGVRAVRTETFARAQVNTQAAPGAPIIIMPNETSSSYWNVLPTANIAAYITPETIFRLGYGKGITRPSVDALNPTIGVDTTTGLGGRGNPNLRPQLADSYDVSIEHYFSPVNYVALAFFYKKIDGFFSGVTSCQTVSTYPAYTGATANGCTGGQYAITQTVNAAKGSAKGVEASGQTFLDFGFMPNFMHNFGVSGSFTYVDTKNPLMLNGVLTDTPQPFTSKYSWTAAGFFENELLTARLVYTHRSEAILFGVSANPMDGRYIGSFGMLDASVSFNLNKNVSFSVNASNLTNAAANRYVGEPDHATGIERQHFVNGRNFGATLRIKFGT